MAGGAVDIYKLRRLNTFLARTCSVQFDEYFPVPRGPNAADFLHDVFTHSTQKRAGARQHSCDDLRIADADPLHACQKLTTFLPELADMDYATNFEVNSIDGTLNRPITDLNPKIIAALPADTVAAMNDIFMHHRDTIEAWG